MIDRACTIELFKEEEVSQVVGGRHGGEGKAEMSAGFEGFWEAVWAAEDEGEVPTLVLEGFDCFCEVFRGKFWADGVKNDQNIVLRNRNVDLRGV